VVQHDAFDALPSVTLLPLTSDLRALPLVRVPVHPGEETGLRVRSEIQIDKVMTIPREKVGPRIGALDEVTMQLVNEALGRFLGLGWSLRTEE
jgi:mRNA interferase MazF